MRRHTRFDCDWSSDVCSSDLRPDEGEHPGVGGGVRARRAADRRLVDVHDLVDALGALDPIVRPGAILGAVEHLGERAVEDVVDERDRKSTRLNSSHSQISYAVFCLKKKKY